jgi:tRNA-modifying protein YgfZ
MPLPPNPLHSFHEHAGASFLPWGPEIQIVETYGELELEYAALRKGAALLDMPRRAAVLLTGKDRATFLQSQVTNDLRPLAASRGTYAFLLNLKGRIVLDLNILDTGDALLVELDRRLAAGFVQDIQKYLFSEDVHVTDQSDSLAHLSLLGPQAAALLAHLGATSPTPATPNPGIAIPGSAPTPSLPELPLSHTTITLAGIPVRAFRNDLAGESQWDLLVPRDRAADVWQALLAAGGDTIPVRPIGWAAFNIARIEAGTPLLGIDITDHSLPLETAHWYPRAVSTTKGCYLGQEIVARMHTRQAAARMLVGLRVDADAPPLAGTDILDPASPTPTTPVGIVTSSCLSPMLGNSPIALASVKTPFATPGTKLQVLTHHAKSPARVTEIPFWQRPSAAPTNPGR